MHMQYKQQGYGTIPKSIAALTIAGGATLIGISAITAAESAALMALCSTFIAIAGGCMLIGFSFVNNPRKEEVTAEAIYGGLCCLIGLLIVAASIASSKEGHGGCGGLWFPLWFTSSRCFTGFCGIMVGMGGGAGIYLLSEHLATTALGEALSTSIIVLASIALITATAGVCASVGSIIVEHRPNIYVHQTNVYNNTYVQHNVQYGY